MEDRGDKRAAPRKARKDPSEAPLFLQKTYQMVDTSTPAIVSWSVDGDTFVVKNLENFCDLLPKFFKHRNFRSFVRQLNFYGFRKLRADSLTERPAGWWEFKHERFLRGHPELLPLIKRAEHYEDEQPEVTGGGKPVVKMGSPPELLNEITTLKGRVDSMSTTIEQLTELVDSLLLERSGGAAAPVPLSALTAADALSKKRKMATGTVDLTQCAFDTAPVNEQDETELLRLMPTTLETASSDDVRMLATNFDFSNPEDAALQPPSLIRATSNNSINSIGGSGGVGADFLPQELISQLFKQVSLDVVDSQGVRCGHGSEPFMASHPSLGRTTSAIACNV